MEKDHNSTVLAMELPFFYIKPSIWSRINMVIKAMMMGNALVLFLK